MNIGIISLLVLFLPLVISLVSWFCSKRLGGRKLSLTGEIFKSLIAGILLWVMVGGFTCVALIFSNPVEGTKFMEYEIVSASTADYTEGSVWILGGYIDTKPVYKAYKKNPDGSLIMVTMDALITRIVETDSVPPHIKEYYEGKFVPKWNKWYQYIFGDMDGKLFEVLFTHYKLHNTGTIYIPTGTIKPTFEKLNL